MDFEKTNGFNLISPEFRGVSPFKGITKLTQF